jgi:hypothetical protein
MTPASIKSAASKIRICLNLPLERFLFMLSRAVYLDSSIMLAFGSPNNNAYKEMNFSTKLFNVKAS